MKKLVLLTIGLLASLLTTQAQVFTNTNVVVLRITGNDATSGNGAAIMVDEFQTNQVAAVANTPVYSFAVPNTSSGTALITVGLSYSGLMTMTPSGNNLVIPGYNQVLSTSTSNPSFNTAVSRAAGSLDAYGNFSLPIVLPNTVFSGFTLTGAASDGTNYWMTANGPANEFITGSYPEVVYVGTAGAPTAVEVVTNVFSSTIRAVNCFYNSTAGAYNLFVCGTSTNTPTTTIYHGGTWAVSNISGALPMTQIGASNNFPDATGTGGTGGTTADFDISINPAGTIAFMANDSTGIVKFTYSGGVWTSNYTVSLVTAAPYTTTASVGATSVATDWSQSPPVVYATSGEVFTNRLVRFVDNGSSSPAIVIMATNATPISGPGGVTNTFRGVRFGLQQYAYISVPPVAFTGPPGATATFSATVLGSPTPTLQWYSNSVANPTYVAIPGATSATLNLANINNSQSGSLFYLVAVNSYGTTTSSPVALTVQNPAISVQPVGATNFPGTGSVTLCVSAVGTGTLTYQWLSNNISLGVGAQSSCYSPPTSAVSNTTSYTVIVSNNAGSVTSSPAIVAFTPYLLYDTFTYPNGVLFGDAGSPWTEESGSNPIYETNGRVQISQTIGSLGTAFGQSLFTQPIAAGSTILWASFTINLSTLPATTGGTYLAYFQSTNFNFYGRIIAVTSNNPAYTPDMPAVAGPGTYRLGIANNASVPSAVVELDMAPGIDYQVVVYFDMADGNFCQLAVNPSQAEYSQVYSPLVNVPSSLVSGVTTDPITPAALPMAAYGLRQAANVGIMQLDNLQVSYDWNGAGSGFAAVTGGVTPALPVIGLVTPGITNYLGNSNVLEVAASGIDLTYAWYQGTTPLSDGNSLTGSSTYKLTINPEVSSNNGNYTVVVSNSVGSVTSSIVPVFINTTPTPPSFTLQPVSATVALGGNVTFTASAVGTGPITYAWNTDGSPNGATGSSYTLTRVTTNLSGNTYSVTASGGAAPPTTSTNAVLTVLGPIVTNIAFLRSLQVTNAAPTITVPASNSTAVYQVTAVVIDYTNIESSTYAEYWIQDSTGGIEFFVTDPTFRPHLGDVVTVSGVVDVFSDALELDGSANNPQEPYTITSTNGETSPLPYPSELIPFGFATANPGLSSLVYQGSRGTFTNVYFATPGAAIAGNGTLVVSNLAGQTYSIYVSQSAGPDLAGQPVPAFAYSVTGAYDQFDSSYELNISAGSDIVTAPPPAVTNLAASVSGGNVTLNWTTVPSSYTYSVWSSTNVAGPYAPLAPGLWFNSTNGTYTGTAPSGPATFYEIVSP